MDDVVVLYRPVGSAELELIKESGSREFPARLPDQPIFYPVVNEAYAIKIARDWNARLNEDKAGFVTRFHVRRIFLDMYETHIVGGTDHEEYWIPAQDLDDFNKSIVGEIEVIAEFVNT